MELPHYLHLRALALIHIKESEMSTEDAKKHAKEQLYTTIMYAKLRRLSSKEIKELFEKALEEAEDRHEDFKRKYDYMGGM